jgi:xanthine/uracil permease
MNSVPQNVWDRIPQMSPGDLTEILFMVVVGVVAAIAIIGGVVYAIHKNRLENALKRELLDRGLSADEIATVVSAKAGKTDAVRRQ